MTRSAAGLSAHSALLYREPAELVAPVRDFLGGGLAGGERVLVMTAGDTSSLLRGALGRHARDVEFVDAGQLCGHEGRMLRALVDLGPVSGSRGVRIVAEHDLRSCGTAAVRSYSRMESAVNLVLAPYAMSLLCTYDASLPDAVLDACRQTHPLMLEPAGPRPSAEYVEPRSFLAESVAVVQPPTSAAALRCDRPEGLAEARRVLRGLLGHSALGEEAREHLVVAVDEVLANAIVHGEPPRELFVYREGPCLVCHVRDGGSGFADPLLAYLPPVEDSVHGRGLWLARQIADRVETASDRSGTHVRLMTCLPGESAPASRPTASRPTASRPTASPLG